MERKWTVIEGAPGVPAPKGAYSPAIRAGDFIYVSGQVPTDPATGKVVGEDVAGQTRYVIAKLGAVLERAGCTLADVVSITAWLSDIGNWDEFNDTYRTCFAAPYPTRTTVGAGLHGVLVEITAVAYAPQGSAR